MSYRDYFAYTDNNLGFVEEVDIVDAGLDFHSASGSWVFSIYGKNLLDEVSFGNDTQLPATLDGLPLGGTFAPVMPGVRYGVEITYNLLQRNTVGCSLLADLQLGSPDLFYDRYDTPCFNLPER